MVTLAERQKAAHTAFDPEQKALLRRAVGILKDQFVKLKKKEADLGVDPIDTRRKLRILEGDETHPGIVTILAEPSEGDGVQLDGFYEQNGAREVEEEDEPEASSEVEPPPVPTPETIQLARVFLGSVPDQKRAYDPEAWDEEPADDVLEAIEFVKAHGWARARELAEAEHGTGEGPEPVEDQPEELEDDDQEENPWDEHQMGLTGEELMRAIPFRGTLVKSGLSLGEIREHWKGGKLGDIHGIGVAGVKRLTEWFEDMEARLLKSRAADSDPSEPTEAEEAGGAAPSGVSEGDPDDPPAVLLAAGEEAPAPGGTLQLAVSRSGAQLAFTKEGARVPTFWPVKVPYLTEEEALELGDAILEGELTWDEVKAGAWRKEPGEAPETPREGKLPDPAPGHEVVVQTQKGALRYWIGGIPVVSPHLARLVDSPGVEEGKHGERVRGETVGFVPLEKLRSTIQPGEWTTSIEHVELPED